MCRGTKQTYPGHFLSSAVQDDGDDYDEDEEDGDTIYHPEQS